MEHLVVYSEREVNKLRRKRRAKFVWARKRREPPVGAVKAGDMIYFKSPGGGVFAKAKVLNVKDFLKGGRYYVNIGISKPQFFSRPFAIIKRDRRSWVVCNGKNNINQQALIALPSPTLADCVKAVKNHYRVLPVGKDVLETLEHLAAAGKKVEQLAGILFLLAIIASEKNNLDLQNELRHLLGKHPEKVTPLAIFRGK